MSHPDSSLPDAWVERIWQAMRATYGASFDRQWECPAGADPVEHVRSMKAFWARELRGFQQNPQAIGHALDHLPPHPPNLVEFRSLCIRRPDPSVKALPAPKADPARVAAALSKLRGMQSSAPKAWAWALRERELGGDKLSPAQRMMWREAIGAEVAQAEAPQDMELAA